MKNIKLFIILFLQVSLVQFASAQSEKKVDLDNGRPAGMVVTPPAKKGSDVERNMETLRSGSDQDVPGTDDFFSGTDWVLPQDLDMLLDMIEDLNNPGKGPKKNLANDVSSLESQLKRLQLENEQMKIDLNNMFTKLSSCCLADIAPNEDNSKAFVLQNAPNPAVSTTFVSYYIPTEYDSASLKITDLTGKVIKTIPISEIGTGKVNIDIDDLASGTYIYSMIVDDLLVQSKIMNVTK